jgi:hypothetical protein
LLLPTLSQAVDETSVVVEAAVQLSLRDASERRVCGVGVSEPARVMELHVRLRATRHPAILSRDHAFCWLQHATKVAISRARLQIFSRIKLVVWPGDDGTVRDSFLRRCA